MKNKNRYWYFVTQKAMGDVMSLSPRTPWGISEDEPMTKRICVAPTAAHCMSAINLWPGCVYVYRTRRKVMGHTPYSVGDAYITKEHWLKNKTRFILVKVLHIPEGLDYFMGDRCSLDNMSQQAYDKKLITNWCRRIDRRLSNINQADVLWRQKVFLWNG